MSEMTQGWMTPEDALSRFDGEEMTVLDLNLPTKDKSIIRYGYRFDNIGFLVGEGVLSEVINDYVIYPMPNCSTWLAGLVSVRGNLVPVYDLVKMFELKTKAAVYKHLLIIDQGASSIGILLERLPQSLDVINWKSVSHKPNLSSTIKDYINESYSVDDTVWMDIDHTMFFKSIRDEVAL